MSWGDWDEAESVEDELVGMKIVPIFEKSEAPLKELDDPENGVFWADYELWEAGYKFDKSSYGYDEVDQAKLPAVIQVKTESEDGDGLTEMRQVVERCQHWSL